MITIIIKIHPIKKAGIIQSIADEIREDNNILQQHIRNNEIIIEKINTVLPELQKFLSDNLGDLPVKIEPFEDSQYSEAFVGLISTKLKCNFSSNYKARFGFKVARVHEWSNKYHLPIYTGEIKISMITRYSVKDIVLDDINEIFEFGRGTLKEMMVADYGYK